MNKIGFAILISIFFLLGNKSDVPVDQQHGLIPNTNMLHIGIVVKDIDKALDHWSKFLGLKEKPNISIATGHPDNPTQYRGHPSNAQAKLAFMDLENLRVELIEPIGDEPSNWKEFLDTKGEGVHHIAFEVKGLGEQYVGLFDENGYAMAQHGGWDGGEYGYMDGSKNLGVVVELLEFYGE